MNSANIPARSGLIRLGLALACVSVVLPPLAGCAAAALGGVAGGVLIVSDRRTSGTQVEDEGIELRSFSRLNEVFGDRGHINVTSYNRQALLTGEVPTEADKKRAEDVVSRVDNVQRVLNELAVMPNTSIGQRSNDALITGKVKAAFVDAPDLFANAFKVVTERNVVYLMGRVTEREAARATEVARRVGGVARVIRSLEIISEEEMARIQPKPQPQPTQPAQQ
jgi:osmotically-inducible protein OsmY